MSPGKKISMRRILQGLERAQQGASTTSDESPSFRIASLDGFARWQPSGRPTQKTTAGPRGGVHVCFTFEIKKKKKKKCKKNKAVFREASSQEAQPPPPPPSPSPPCLSTMTPTVSLQVSPTHLHSPVQNLVHMRQKHPASRTASFFGFGVSHDRIRPAR